MFTLPRPRSRPAQTAAEPAARRRRRSAPRPSGPPRSPACSPSSSSTSSSRASPHESRCRRPSAGRRSTSPSRSPSASASGRSSASTAGIEYYTGYLVEKSLSVDNLFVFILLLSAFAVPRELQQRVLLIGVAGALVLRGIFIALGAQMIASFSWAFLLFGAILLVTAVKVRPRRPLRRRPHGRLGSHPQREAISRFWPVTDDYEGTRLSVTQAASAGSPRSPSSPSPSSAPTSSSRSTRCPPSTASPATPTSSSPPTPSPCSACAPSTSSLEGALSSLVHLGHGLALILAFIGVKLVLHWGARRLAGCARDPDAGLARRHRRHPRARHPDQPRGQPPRRAPGRGGDTADGSSARPRLPAADAGAATP